MREAAGELHQAEHFGQHRGCGYAVATRKLCKAGFSELVVELALRRAELHISVLEGLRRKVEAFGFGYAVGYGVFFLYELLHVLVAYDLMLSVAAHYAVAVSESEEVRAKDRRV
ncbi:MAG: hypothetical protein ACLTGJ_02265 [Faecalibacterium prausnitzii]